MGWERGRYYTRSRRVDGRVVREYVGGGDAGQQAEAVDAVRRAEVLALRREERAVVTGLELRGAGLEAVLAESLLVVRCMLLAAGFHRPKRGLWRPRRG